MVKHSGRKVEACEYFAGSGVSCLNPPEQFIDRNGLRLHVGDKDPPGDDFVPTRIRTPVE